MAQINADGKRAGFLVYAKHGAILPEEVKNDIGSAIGLAGIEKFPAFEDDCQQEFARLSKADDLMTYLNTIEKRLIEKVLKQSTT